MKQFSFPLQVGDKKIMSEKERRGGVVVVVVVVVGRTEGRNGTKEAGEFLFIFFFFLLSFLSSLISFPILSNLVTQTQIQKKKKRQN